MSNSILNRICNDDNDPILRVKLQCKHGDLLSMQTSWSEDNPARRFWSCPCYREIMQLRFRWKLRFRWRNPKRTDLRSKIVILRLTKRINELEEALAFYESNGKWVVKKEKKSKCCNWKLIAMIVIVFFLF
ncbi:hypothetical protein P3S67_023526 [Capsicum chacoense]